MPEIRTQAEIKLLLSLLSDNPRFTLAQNPRTWAIIQQSAPRHGLAPLVAFHARAHVSDDGRAWCDRVLAQSCSSYHRSLRDLQTLTATLGGQGIQVLALKGPVLATRYYDPAFLRMPSGDLDFAVRESEIEGACDALKREGYSLASPLDQARVFSHHIALRHPDRVALELHFRLSHGPRGIPVDRLFDQAVPFRLPNGMDVLTLDGASEIMHLALHAACGRFRPIFHLFELRRICRIQGARVLRDAVRIATEFQLARVLPLVDAAFQTCWEEPFLPADGTPLTQLEARRSRRLFEECLLWSELAGSHTLRSRLLGRWIDLQTTDRPAQALWQAGMLIRFAWSQFSKRGWKDASRVD